MKIFETRSEAWKNDNGDNAILQVEGGYIICSWDEYYRRLREEAEALYDGGWRCMDAEDLEIEYGFDSDHAVAICMELSDIEGELIGK